MASFQVEGIGMEASRLVDSVRLNDTDRRTLLAAVNKRGNTAPEAARRGDARYALPPGYSMIGEVVQNGGSAQHVIVTVRDVSRSGLAMLHGGFLYNGTICRFVLRGANKEELCQVDGKVVRCSHVKGHVHDVGVKFSSPLPVEALLQVSDLGPGGAKCQYPSLLCLLEEMTELTRNGADLSVIAPMLQELVQAIQESGGETSKLKVA